MKNTTRLLLLSALMVGLTAAQQSSAITLTFAGASGFLTGSASEGIFSYDEFSGGLTRNTVIGGNPVPHLESVVNVGGVLRIVRNDIAGGLFTFDFADVAVYNFNGNNVAVEGFLLGASQGIDTLITQAGNDNWATRASVILNGVFIDELRITLNSSSSGLTELDNVVLTTPTAQSVPDAGGTLALLLAGCVCIGGLRRRLAR